MPSALSSRIEGQAKRGMAQLKQAPMHGLPKDTVFLRMRGFQDALDGITLKPGERFLDVAAGTGGLSLPAARRGATVLATDWSPAMIERFEARVHEAINVLETGA